MTPLRTWASRAALIAVPLLAATWGGLFLLSERALHATSAWGASPLGPVSTDAAAVREGERLGRVLGCTTCHGPALGGAPYHDQRLGAHIVAPNLTRVAPTYTDDELARAVRAGVARDGRALFGMPTRAFRHLADDDVRRLVAWIRSVPAQPDADRASSLGLGARVRLVMGRALPDALTIDPGAPTLARGETVIDRGRYLAHVACGECHGASLDGDGARVPPLTVAVAYTEPAFAHLLRTGATPGGRDLTLMDDTARTRFAHLTDDEIAAAYAYLRARTGQ